MQNEDTLLDEEMMAPLRAFYLKELETKYARLKSLLDTALKGSLSPEQKEDLLMLSHTLSGSGASYGFPALSDKGRALEQRLLTEHSFSKETLRDLQNLNEACERALGINEEGAPTLMTGPPPKPTSAGLEKKEPQLVLVANDDAVVRGLLCGMLRDGAIVLTARTAEEALNVVQTRTPDLIFLDDSLPGTMSSLNLLEKLWSNLETASIPIVMITANVKSEIVQRGLAFGVMDCITKPIQPQQIAGKVRQWLDCMGRSVMVVDDDVSIRALLENRFRPTGVRIFLAAEGEQALAMMKTNRPNLVILDRKMPTGDGFSVLQKMREDSALASVPVILLTACNQAEDVLTAKDKDIVDYIVKPFNASEVVSRCLRVLKNEEQKRRA